MKTLEQRRDELAEKYGAKACQTDGSKLVGNIMEIVSRESFDAAVAELRRAYGGWGMISDVSPLIVPIYVCIEIKRSTLHLFVFAPHGVFKYKGRYYERIGN